MWVVISVLYACGFGQAPIAASNGLGTFEQELALAEAYDPNRPHADVDKNRDTAIEHYRSALALRPEDKDNMPIEYELGVLLSVVANPGLGQKPDPLEARPYFERVAGHYVYDDYYESVSPSDPEGPITQQGMMIHAAIASGLFQKRPEEARGYYDRAMQYLASTIDRRCQDWWNEPPPPAKVVDPLVLKMMPDVNRGYDARKAAWEAGREAAETGEVFSEVSKNLSFAKEAVKRYMSSFGNVPPDSAPRLMEPILRRYPGTPMARFAADIIEEAKQAGKQPKADPARDTAPRLAQEVTEFKEHKLAVPAPAVLAEPRAPAATPLPAEREITPDPIRKDPGMDRAWLWRGSAVGALLIVVIGSWRWRKGR